MRSIFSRTSAPRRRSSRSSRIVLFAAAAALLTPNVFPEVARAAVDDQRREVQRIVDELDRLHTQADILAEDYAEAVDQKNQLDVEVTKAEERVAAKEAEVEALRGDLAEVAIRKFTGAGGDVLGPLFSDAATYTDGMRRDQYSRVALSVGTATTDDLDQAVKELGEERADLESKRDQVEQLKQTIDQKLAQTKELTAQYEQQRDQAEARLGQLIAEEEQRRAEEAYAKAQAELAAQQAAARQAAASSSSSNANSGGGGGGGGSSGSSSSGSSGSGGGGGAVAAPAPVTNLPPVSGLAGVAIQAALSQQGKPYVYATAGPDSYDCSGLTHYAWGKAGVYLPRNSRAQAASTPRIPVAAAQPGDLIFYYSPISHVGIYLGNGMMVHAPNSGSSVKTASVSWNKVTAVSRPG